MADHLVQLGVRVPASVFDRIDSARGDVPRAKWVLRAVETALAEAGVRANGGGHREAPSREPEGSSLAPAAASAGLLEKTELSPAEKDRRYAERMKRR